MDYLNYVYPVIGLGGLLAVFVMAFRNGRNTNLTTIQEQTITALQTQINSLKDKISELEKENTLQGHLIDLITSALKKKGMIVTIDGDMITISGKDGSSSTIVRQAQPKTKITKAVTVTKESEQL
jgi:hypothetical protein